MNTDIRVILYIIFITDQISAILVFRSLMYAFIVTLRVA